MELFKKLCENKLLSSKAAVVCYEACIPSKGLNLDLLIDYFEYMKVKGMYLFSYDGDLTYSFFSLFMFRGEVIPPNINRSVSPLLILDTEYTVSLDPIQSPTMIKLFVPEVAGLWVPYLPLAIRSASSLEKGILIYNSHQRDLSYNPESVVGICQSRIGLIGNPSDGYYGNTISIALDNFATRVDLLKTNELHIIPHALFV